MESNPTFTLDQVVAVTGLKKQLLVDWVADGTVVPAVPGGRGRGNGNRFTLMQAVGIMTGVAVKKLTERSCTLAYMSRIIAAFEGLDEDTLAAWLDEGRTWFLTVHAGVPVLTAETDDSINVAPFYRYLKSKAPKFENRITKFVNQLKK